MIPNPDTYCEIDPNVVDEWGIPVLRFHFKWSEYELRQAKDMQETFRAIVEMAGGTYLTKAPIDGPRAYGIAAGGKIIHEVGTARMGADPKTSVLNGYCQAHDVKNLFVTDGAPLVTNPDKNPTLTIMALSWRASEYLLDEARKGKHLMSEDRNSRRDILRTLAVGAAAGSVLQMIPAQAAEFAHRLVQKEKAASAGKYAPKFFPPHQYETLMSLCDTIIPKDDNSGGAVEAGAPEFIDLLTSENVEYQTQLGGGLMWLDTYCIDRSGKFIWSARRSSGRRRSI